MSINSWLEPVIGGITVGLVLSAMLGPVFFSLLQTSLHEGFKAGAHLAFGVLLSDAALIAICFSFASLLQLIDTHQTVLSWVGGLLLIGFGVFNFFHRIPLKEVDDNKKTVHAHFVLKGFLLNIFNPAVFLFWLGVVGIVAVKADYLLSHKMIYFSATLITVFLIDLLKSLVAHRIKNFLRPVVMIWINRIIGLALAAFGLNMILR